MLMMLAAGLVKNPEHIEILKPLLIEVLHLLNLVMPKQCKICEKN